MGVGRSDVAMVGVSGSSGAGEKKEFERSRKPKGVNSRGG